MPLTARLVFSISRQASRCQQAFSKPCLVNMISKDTHLVFSISWPYSCLIVCKYLKSRIFLHVGYFVVNYFVINAYAYFAVNKISRKNILKSNHRCISCVP